MKFQESHFFCVMMPPALRERLINVRHALLDKDGVCEVLKGQARAQQKPSVGRVSSCTFPLPSLFALPRFHSPTM